ncbi:MAG: hypothetical protein IT322_21505, partial [Anaerolineae bacterium]|nr:hypothetical protein [Anaerolineae bacterium]
KESGNIVLMLMIRFGATTSYQSVKVGTMIPDSMRANVGEQDSLPLKVSIPPFYRVR